MNEASEVVISLCDVTKRFGSLTALEHVSLDISRGERVALIGPSGAGKTTILKLMAGMYQPSEGSILVEGRRAARLTKSELRSIRRRTGFIHQSLDLVPELRVVSNVLAGRLGYCGLFGTIRKLLLPSRSDLVACHRALGQVDLTDKMYQRTDTLSGGQAQRVAVARVLFQDPDIVLADEPVSSVDPARARDLLDLLRRINTETMKPIVVSLHAVDLAREYCTRLVGVREGRITFSKSVADVNEDDLSTLYALAGQNHG